jgi:hypothetical protein
MADHRFLFRRALAPEVVTKLKRFDVKGSWIGN